MTLTRHDDLLQTPILSGGIIASVADQAQGGSSTERLELT